MLQCVVKCTNSRRSSESETNRILFLHVYETLKKIPTTHTYSSSGYVPEHKYLHNYIQWRMYRFLWGGGSLVIEQLICSGILFPLTQA